MRAEEDTLKGFHRQERQLLDGGGPQPAKKAHKKTEAEKQAESLSKYFKNGGGGKKFFSPQGVRSAFVPKQKFFQTVRAAPTLPHQSLEFNANLTDQRQALTFTGERGMASRALISSTGLPVSDCVFNGIAEPGKDPRWPDVFSLCKTSTIVQAASLQCTSWNSSTTAGGYTYNSALVLFGCNVTPGVSMTGVAGTDTVAWNSGSVIPSLYTASDFVGRPCGHVFDVFFNLQGIDHTIEMNAFPFISLNNGNMVASPTGWPTHLNAGPNDLHNSWGARSFHIKSGAEPVRFVSLPLDSRCLDFQKLSVERGDYSSTSGVAWSGWCVWFNSLSAADVVRVVCTDTTEMSVIPFGTSTTYLYPASTRAFSPNTMAKATEILAHLSDMGYTAYQWGSKVMNMGVGEMLSGMMNGLSERQLLRVGATARGQMFGPPSIDSGLQLLKQPHNLERIFGNTRGSGFSLIPSASIGSDCKDDEALNAEEPVEVHIADSTSRSTPPAQSQSSSSMPSRQQRMSSQHQ